jgi:DNA-binding NarL/FixJ family response regulator
VTRPTAQRTRCSSRRGRAAEIAEELVLSEATVKTHVGRVLAKLELRDRVQIVVYAYERGLISPAA